MKLQDSCTRYALVGVLMIISTALIGCGDSEEPVDQESTAATAATVEKPKPAKNHDGSALFLEHCAGCHGKTGDGKGTTKLTQPARNFRAGGFAFGNTPDALFKMVTSGMPGRNPMPSFADILTEDERRAVVQHVLTLVPQTNRKPAKDRVLQVKDRALIARGLVPPIAKGAPDWPRGLLIGLPSGWTLAYSTECVRLLGGYFGAFCDRTDWDQRGGGSIKPMGRLMFHTAGGNPLTCWKLAKGRQPLKAKFAASFADGEIGGVEYTLQLPEGARTIRETCQFIQTAGGSGVKRAFEIPPTQSHLLIGQLQEKGCRSQRTKKANMVTWQRAPGDFTCLIAGETKSAQASGGFQMAGVSLIADDGPGGSGEIQMAVLPSPKARRVWLFRAFTQSNTDETTLSLYEELNR